jgi:hypothetical protein
MRRTGWITLVLVAAILGVLLWVPSWLASRQFAEVLRPYVQQNGSLRVNAWTTPLGYLRGEIRRLNVDAREIKLGDLTADRLRASLSGVRLTRARSSPSQPPVRARSGQITAEVAADDLERFLRGRDVRNPVVKIDPSGVAASGHVRAGAVEVETHVRGQFDVSSSRDLRFRVTSLQVSGVEVPPAVAGTIVAAVQPAISLQGLPFPLAIDRVSTTEGRIIIQARVVETPP